MKNIKDYDLEDLKQELIELGEKAFRAEQIFKWLYVDKVKSFDEMTNLSLELREKLKANYNICNFKILKKLESSDGTKKYTQRSTVCNRICINAISLWKIYMCFITSRM